MMPGLKTHRVHLLAVLWAQARPELKMMKQLSYLVSSDEVLDFRSGAGLDFYC